MMSPLSKWRIGLYLAAIFCGRRRRSSGAVAFRAIASVYVMLAFGSAEELLRSPQLNDISCMISDAQMSPNGLELLANMRQRGYAAPFLFRHSILR